MSSSSSSSSSSATVQSAAAAKVAQLQAELAKMVLAVDSEPVSPRLSGGTGTELAAPPRITKEQLMEMPHAMGANLMERLAGGGVGKGKKKKGLKSERHVECDMYGKVPWVPRPPVRNFEMHTIWQSLDTSLVSTSTTLPTFASSYFVVNSMSDYASWSAVFDQYRITMIEAYVTATSVNLSSTTTFGQYTTAVDLDDANTPTALGDLQHYTSSVETNLLVPHYHRWVPTFSVAAYSGAFTSYSQGYGWLDCGSPNIQHYGLKVACTNTPAQVMNMLIRFRLHVSFRAVH